MLKKKQNLRLVFVRHGESEKNTLNMYSSTIDKWPLTERGVNHANIIADKLMRMGHFDIILSSPVLRARQTAEVISARLGLPVKIEELLGEYEHGFWNDIPKEKLFENHSDYREYKSLKRGSEEHFDFKLGGAESRADVVERIKKFIKKVAKEYPGKKILLVSHAGINSAIAMAVENISIESFYEKESIGHEEIETFYITT